MSVVLTRPVTPVKLRVVPRNRECNRGVQERAEVVGIVRVFPEVVGIDEQEFAHGLLENPC